MGLCATQCAYATTQTAEVSTDQMLDGLRACVAGSGCCASVHKAWPSATHMCAARTQRAEKEVCCSRLTISDTADARTGATSMRDGRDTVATAERLRRGREEATLCDIACFRAILTSF